MDISNWLSLVGGSFVQHIPHLLVIGLGLVFCFLKLKNFPKASRTAMIGLAILFIINLIGIFLPAIFVQISYSFRDDISTVGIINFAVGFIFSLIGAVGLALVIYAVWLGRDDG